MPPDGKPRPGELGFQFDPRVDAHMPPRDLVIFRRQAPADPFRQPAGHRDRRQPAGPQHARELVHRPLVIENVLERLRRDHAVERAVAERHRGGVPRNRRRPGGRGGLARLPHRAEHPGHSDELRRIKVERDHVRAAPVNLEGVPPAAAAQVEHAVPRPDREPAEIDGQHAGSIASRYRSAVALATAAQANRSLTRASARSASAARSAGEACTRLSTAASPSSSPGVTRTAASPVTSGRAPVRLATSGVPDAMCSTAGSEKPSYSEGTTAISALASSAENASSSSPWVNVIRSSRDSWAASRSVAGAGLPTMTRCTSRSVATLPTARSSVATPLIAESALATAMIRPGTRAPSRGRNTRVSTPSGMMRSRSGGTRKSRELTRVDDSATVISGSDPADPAAPAAPDAPASRRATLACIRTNPYQRRRDSRASQPHPARSVGLPQLS